MHLSSSKFFEQRQKDQMNGAEGDGARSHIADSFIPFFLAFLFIDICCFVNNNGKRLIAIRH